MDKKVLVKVYRSNGEFLKAWDDATFEGFSKNINGGLGECVIKLARKWDDYGEGFDVKLNNEVQILITDEDTIDTDDKCVRIYSGYISKYTPWVEGAKEGITVTLLGYYTKLAQDILKNSTTTTLYTDATNGLTVTSPGSAADLGLVMRAVMDRYIAETTNPKLHYAKADIPLTSTTALYTFEMMTYQEAIDIVRDLAPADWWWYVNQWHEVLFKTKPSTATHTFIFGRHFHKVYVEKSMEKIKNAMLFWNTNAGSPLYRFYTDAASITDYGRRVERRIDQDRVGAAGDADKIGEGFVAEHKNPDIKVVVEILDNNEDPNFGYDIESIEPGDTCNFAGFNEKLDETFKENMLITSVDYTLSKAVVTIEPMKAGVVEQAEKVAREVKEINTKDTPASYTAV